MVIPALPPNKTFTPKHNLPTLHDYSAAPQNFWLNFPSNYVRPAHSRIDADLLESLAHECNFTDTALLAKILNDVRCGAKIGCKGAYREHSRATNAPSALADGEKVTDAVADWIVKGFAYGPVEPHEVPPKAKFSGMMTRPKPNGSVRIILNLSAPIGSSVNEGINKEEFPASMASTTDWLRVLNRAGRNCKFCKIDWADAYKQITVHPEDIDLQWFSWLGKAFAELCLVFGCVSSAGLFDRLAKLIIHIVAYRAEFDTQLVCQVLDDCCAAAPCGSTSLERFDAEFFNVASQLGISLAPRDDPKKSFGPATSGTVLGVDYDSVTWTWAINEEKLGRILSLIRDTMDSSSVELKSFQSLVGKLVHVKPLVAGAKFNLDHILRALKDATDSVVITAEVKRQLFFWFTMLQTCSALSSIPNPDAWLPPWALEVFTDAAGGSWRSKGHGVGAVMVGWWAIAPWSRAINTGRPTGDGRSLDRVLSALELIGPLLVLCAGHHFCRLNAVKVYVDNAGSVFIWKKGYSTSCALSSTLVKAMASVAAGIGCNFDVVKITRCSSPLSSMADALSKADFARFWGIAYQNGGFNLGLDPAWVPPSLLQWIDSPRPDDSLGSKLLRDIATRGHVLGFH